MRLLDLIRRRGYGQISEVILTEGRSGRMTRRIDGFATASGTVSASGTVTLTMIPPPGVTWLLERANISGGIAAVVFHRRFVGNQAHVGGATPGTLAFDPPLYLAQSEALLAVISAATPGDVFTVSYDGMEAAYGL